MLGALAAGLFFKQEIGDAALDFGGSFLLVGGWLLGWTALVGLLWFGRRSLVRDWGRR